MGEVVMEVVERIIGREVNADVHRDLIDQAVTALREEPDAAAASAGARQ
jgi:F0F1-type ATP synthase membrane subunit b/b'